jgi:hypothetical protein
MSGKIVTVYKIVCKDENITDIYIGSTCRKLKERIYSHFSAFNNNKNYKVYEFMRKNGSFENFEFKILNEIEYFDKSMQLKQEQAYINCYKPTLNDHNAYRSEEEKKEYSALFRTNPENKEKIKKMRAVYYTKPEIKEKIKEYNASYNALYYAKLENKERKKKVQALYDAKPENKKRIKKVKALNYLKKKVKKNMTKVHDELLMLIFPIP